MGQKNIEKLKTFLNRNLLLISLILFVVLRMVFIFRFPIFNDEALTMRYGKIAIETDYHFYTVAVGGKQPLLFWVDGIATHIIPDPLFAGRIISLLFGLGTMVGIYRLTKDFISPELAKFAALAYAVSPLNILYDGMAIHDAAITSIFCWVIYHLLSLAKRFSLISIASIGALIGIGLWIKTTALLFLLITVLLLGLYTVTKKITISQAGISLLIIFSILTVLMLPLVTRPEFAGVLRMQSEYALTPGAITKLPLDIWYANARNIILVFLGYVSPLVLFSFGFAAWYKRKDKNVFPLIIIFLLTVFLLIFTGKSMHSRYMVFSVIPLFPLFVLFLTRMKTLYILGLLNMLVFSIVLSFSPARFFHLFPNKWVFAFEAWQYVDGWPSGYGVLEALRFVDRERKGQNAFIGVRWDAGNPEDTVLLYAAKLPRIAVSFFDKRLENYEYIIEKMSSVPMYFITRDNQRGGMDENLTLLARFDKPSRVEAVEVYQFVDSTNPK